MAPTIISGVVVPAASSQFLGGQPLDLVALADVKAELKITDGADDAWLKQVITRASKATAAYCNRVFQPQTYKELIWPRRDPYPWQLPPLEFKPLQLATWPISSPPSPAGTAPPLAPMLSGTAGGALPAQRYFVRISYVTPRGETAASIEANLYVAANSLLTVASPANDAQNIATGWNVYVGSKSFGEVLQASSLPIGAAWTMPAAGLVTTGASPPNHILAVENFSLSPQPLAEGIDFATDYDAGTPSRSKGWLTRFFFADQSPRHWQLPVYLLYQAGFPAIPEDLQNIVIEYIKALWFARTRDPQLRSENVAGVWEAQYWFGSGPGSESGLPRQVKLQLEELGYRVPVIG
jgi:hypothetical protein